MTVTFTNLIAWNTTSTSYGLDPASISQSTLWISGSDNTSATTNLTSLAWVSATPSASGVMAGNAMDTVTLRFPKVLKSDGVNYKVYAYGLKDLNNGTPVTIASLSNIPSLVVASGTTFNY